MEDFSRYVGLDVHKENIAGAMAYPGRSKPESVGVIANTKRSVLRQFVASRLTARWLGFVTRRDRVDTRFTDGSKRRVTLVLWRRRR